MVERCERCGTQVEPDGRTVVLASDARGDVREHVYCSSHCAMAPGTIGATALDAIRRSRKGEASAEERPLA